jgi:hypothetical protein
MLQSCAFCNFSPLQLFMQCWINTISTTNEDSDEILCLQCIYFNLFLTRKNSQPIQIWYWNCCYSFNTHFAYLCKISLYKIPLLQVNKMVLPWEALTLSHTIFLASLLICTRIRHVTWLLYLLLWSGVYKSILKFYYSVTYLSFTWVLKTLVGCRCKIGLGFGLVIVIRDACINQTQIHPTMFSSSTHYVHS